MPLSSTVAASGEVYESGTPRRQQDPPALVGSYYEQGVGSLYGSSDTVEVKQRTLPNTFALHNDYVSPHSHCRVMALPSTPSSSTTSWAAVIRVERALAQLRVECGLACSELQVVSDRSKKSGATGATSAALSTDVEEDFVSQLDMLEQELDTLLGLPLEPHGGSERMFWDEEVGEDEHEDMDRPVCMGPACQAVIDANLVIGFEASLSTIENNIHCIEVLSHNSDSVFQNATTGNIFALNAKAAVLLDATEAMVAEAEERVTHLEIVLQRVREIGCAVDNMRI